MNKFLAAAFLLGWFATAVRTAITPPVCQGQMCIPSDPDACCPGTICEPQEGAHGFEFSVSRSYSVHWRLAGIC